MRACFALVLAGIGAIPLVGCSSESESGPSTRDRSLTSDVPALVRRDCGLAAEKITSGAVYCPPLVPRGSTRSQNRSSRGRVSIDARDDEYTLNFVTATIEGFDPAQPRGFRRHEGHWLISARNDPNPPASGPGASVVDRIEVEGVPVNVVERRWFAYHLDAGHVLAIWPFAGRTFQVSLHGFEHRRVLIEMAEAMISQMRACPPASPEGAPGDPACGLVFAGGAPGRR
ncbi:MAG TPA: hypothetical protein VFZ41_09815 [Solirubrobacterales bacterium]